MIRSFRFRNKIRFETGLFILALFLAAGLSCYQDVILLDLGDPENQIVIECEFIDGPGPAQVKISKSIAINQIGFFPAVDGAEVTISDDEGNSEQLERVRAGLYQTVELQGVPGRTYTLRVAVQGEEYAASSKMPEPIELDRIRMIPVEYMGNEYYSMEMSFQDRPGVEEYCRIKVWVNGSLYDEIFYQDRFSDGECITLESSNSLFLESDHVEVEFYTFDKATYEYLVALYPFGGDMDVDMPEFFPQSMYNPVSNWSNDALGYFSAATLRRVTVQFE